MMKCRHTSRGGMTVTRKCTCAPAIILPYQVIVARHSFFKLKVRLPLDESHCGCNQYPVTYCSLIEELMKGELNFLLAEFSAAAEKWYAIHT